MSKFSIIITALGIIYIIVVFIVVWRSEKKKQTDPDHEHWPVVVFNNGDIWCQVCHKIIGKWGEK